jgi:predicted dinucleotide-binding enzyme
MAMRIGVIGTGNMGGGLGKQWAAKGHQVLFGSRDPQKAKELARAAGPSASGGTYAEAVRHGEVVLLATPWSATLDTVRSLGSLTGKVIIDCTNPLTPDFMGLAIGHTTSAAEEIAKAAPGAHVVKAFNFIFAPVVEAGPQFGSQNATVCICGDDYSSTHALFSFVLPPSP